jgi:hypothetical protein
VKAPKLAGVPRVRARVAGTEPSAAFAVQPSRLKLEWNGSATTIGGLGA